MTEKFLYAGNIYKDLIFLKHLMANSNLTYNRGKTNERVSKFFQKVFLDQKLNNWLGFLIIGLIACFIGYLMAEQTKFGLGLTGLIAGLAVVIVCMSNAETG